MKPVIKKTEEVIELIETIDNDELSLSLSLLFSSLHSHLLPPGLVQQRDQTLHRMVHSSHQEREQGAAREGDPRAHADYSGAEYLIK